MKLFKSDDGTSLCDIYDMKLFKALSPPLFKERNTTELWQSRVNL